MLISRLIFATALVCAPCAALAQAQYSASEVIGHFQQPEAEAAAAQDCPEGAICLPKQATRAVCIGTGSACAGDMVAAPAQQSSFDLLITFELGSDRLSEQAQANLREFAEAMKDPALKDAQFNVDGHTDARGSDALNNELSRRRAGVVVEFLESLGIDRSRLEAQGYGETKPRADDPFAAINRRVEATIRTR
ncbi:MAG TPA: OmpA family protein [Paracoccaceae bacterium]|nr:OmpA family protein [Paracoccaceae bacterium]